MIPAILGASLATKLAGSFLGGNAQNESTQQGMDAYKDYMNQGISTLNQGKSSSNAAFQPYTNAGTQGLQGYQASIQNRQQAAQPSLSNSNPQTAISSYLDPSAAYTSDQAMKATQASAIAKGGMGGGLAKALSNNANKMAMTNYNNAYQQMLDTGNQNFNQQNTIYGNKTAYDQSQIGNYGNLANMGLQATGTNQGLQFQYNNGINQNYGDLAASQQSGYNQKGKTSGDMWNNIGSSLSSGITSLFGGGK